ncbi:MAG: hypothetical protein FWH41_00285 [Treponema sp.]|nr:hypothetical protein [Treponema sp.]
MADEKIRFMKDFVTTDVILAIIEDTGIAVEQAMKDFYNSEVFDRLCDTETGLYRESGGYVYELYKTEKKHGRLVQIEQ